MNVDDDSPINSPENAIEKAKAAQGGGISTMEREKGPSETVSANSAAHGQSLPLILSPSPSEAGNSISLAREMENAGIATATSSISFDDDLGPTNSSICSAQPTKPASESASTNSSLFLTASKAWEKPSIAEQRQKLMTIVHEQLGNSYSYRTPLFTDYFHENAFSKWKDASKSLNCGAGGITGSPRGIKDFEAWLRAGDEEDMAQQALISSTLSKISKIATKERAPTQTNGTDERFMEWNLAGAIVDSGLVCLIGPRNSGKSHLLRRVLHKLTRRKEEEDEDEEGEGEVAFPRPTLPIRVITLHALQTQDPFDLLLFVLNDLREILKIVNEEEVITQLKEEMERGMESLGSKSHDAYHQSRQRLLREKYASALEYLNSVIAKATKKHQLVIVLEDFELLTGERQTFLYNLMDIISLGYKHGADTKRLHSAAVDGFNLSASQTVPTSTPITAVMVTSRLDSFAMLEKRVSSRFPQRQIIFDGHQSLPAVLSTLFQHLIIVDGIPLPPERQILVERRIENRKKQLERSIAAESEGPSYHPNMEAPSLENLDELATSFYANDDSQESSNSLIIQLSDSNSNISLDIAETRRLFFSWNKSVVNAFSNLSESILTDLEDMFSITTNVGDFFQVLLSALARASPTSLEFPIEHLSDSIDEFTNSLFARIEVALSCTEIQLLLLIEIGRLEQQIHAGWAKSGNPFVDVNLPSAALAINMGTAQMLRGKRKSDGTFVSSGDIPQHTIAARQDTLRLQYYHFDRVYYEYAKYVASEPLLTAFKFPKHIVRKEFDQLLAMKLIQFTSSDRYHYSAYAPHVEAVSIPHQFIKCNLSTSDLEMILAQSAENLNLPEILRIRVRL